MNEKFKALRDQAFSMTEWEELDYDRIMEQYGKLIVQECANIASINAHQYQTPGTYVLKHFGLYE